MMKMLSEKMWFEFKGKRNDEFGALLTSMPQRQHPVIQGDKIEINGKDGFMFVSKDRYAAVTVKIDFIVPDNSNARAVRRWMSGNGKLRFSDYKDQYYDAYVLTSYIESSPIPRKQGMRCSVTFTCQPFRRSITEDTTDVFTATKSVFNGSGDVEAYPLLECSGSGTSVLTINGNSLNITLDSSKTIYIDCEAKVVYTLSNGLTSFAGSHLSFANGSTWATLKPESDDVSEWNNINWTGSLTLVVHPRWRWF